VEIADRNSRTFRRARTPTAPSPSPSPVRSSPRLVFGRRASAANATYLCWLDHNVYVSWRSGEQKGSGSPLIRSQMGRARELGARDINTRCTRYIGTAFLSAMSPTSPKHNLVNPPRRAARDDFHLCEHFGHCALAPSRQRRRILPLPGHLLVTSSPGKIVQMVKRHTGARTRVHVFASLPIADKLPSPRDPSRHRSRSFLHVP